MIFVRETNMSKTVPGQERLCLPAQHLQFIYFSGKTKTGTPEANEGTDFWRKFPSIRIFSGYSTRKVVAPVV